MKKVLAALMALIMALSLCACAPKDEAASAEPTTSKAPAVVAAADDPLDDVDAVDDTGLDGEDEAPSTGEPTDEDPEAPETEPSEGKKTGVSTSQYTYTTVENTELAVKYKHPSHWIDVSQEKSIVFEEPNPTGACAARMAITRRDAGKIVVTEEVGMMRLTEFQKKLKASCESGFKWKKGKRFKFSGQVGFCFTYSGTFAGAEVKGYAAIMYQQKKNAFYLFHFNAPKDQYASFDKVRKTLLKGIKA